MIEQQRAPQLPQNA